MGQKNVVFKVGEWYQCLFNGQMIQFFYITKLTKHQIVCYSFQLQVDTWSYRGAKKIKVKQRPNRITARLVASHRRMWKHECVNVTNTVFSGWYEGLPRLTMATQFGWDPAELLEDFEKYVLPMAPKTSEREFIFAFVA